MQTLYGYNIQYFRPQAGDWADVARAKTRHSFKCAVQKHPEAFDYGRSSARDQLLAFRAQTCRGRLAEALVL